MNAYSQELREQQAPPRGLRRVAEGAAMFLLAGMLLVYPSVAAILEPEPAAQITPSLEQLAHAEVAIEVGRSTASR